jgi:hypothetical protein
MGEVDAMKMRVIRLEGRFFGGCHECNSYSNLFAIDTRSYRVRLCDSCLDKLLSLIEQARVS